LYTEKPLNIISFLGNSLRLAPWHLGHRPSEDASWGLPGGSDDSDDSVWKNLLISHRCHRFPYSKSDFGKLLSLRSKVDTSWHCDTIQRKYKFNKEPLKLNLGFIRLRHGLLSDDAAKMMETWDLERGC
jgi:hypothetical protein